jgi:dihydrofolate reductase
MGTIIVSDNVSLDGVIQDPAGDEGFRVGGWVGLIRDRPQLNKLALDEALGTEALLLGRRSYEWLAARWPSRSGELADRLNSLPKYVVSSTLEHPDWNNSTVLKGDVLNEVTKLKHELKGEIVVPASFQLVHTLMEHDLVDELRLKIFPVVLGAGKRLFGETSDKKAMRLVDTRPSRARSSSLPTSPSKTPSGWSSWALRCHVCRRLHGLEQSDCAVAQHPLVLRAALSNCT